MINLPAGAPPRCTCRNLFPEESGSSVASIPRVPHLHRTEEKQRGNGDTTMRGKNHPRENREIPVRCTAGHDWSRRTIRAAGRTDGLTD